MVSSAILFATAFTQAQGPVERFDAFMSRAEGLTLEYEVREDSVSYAAECKLELRRPNSQVYSVKFGRESFKYVHSKNGAISIRDDLKQYYESEPLPINFPPPPNLVGSTFICYPMVMLVKKLRDYDNKAEFKLVGSETINGARCDKVTFEGTNLDSVGTNTLWIDPQGRLVRLNLKRLIEFQQVDITFDFKRIERTAPTDPGHYQTVLPIGYMPYAVPKTKTRTVLVTERAVFGTWTDARTEARVDFKKLAADTPVLLVFTDPDCAISAQAEPFLRSIRTQFKAKGCAIVEVSLGPKKPDLAKKDKDRRVFWDKDGAIEAAYGIPATPYFLVADAKGELVRGWQGYVKEKETDMLKELLGAFDKG